MSSSLVLVDVSNPGIVMLTLNRPEQRNALNGALFTALSAAIEKAGHDKSRRVMILRGQGKVFCAGLDLKEAAATVDQAEQGAHRAAELFKAIHNSRLVTIASIHGAAIAGGAGIVTACDLAIAAEGTQLGYPEVHRGLVAGLVMHFLLRLVGERAARHLTLTGEPIDAAEAHRIGLINSVVPAEQLSERTIALARHVLNGAPNALLRTKQLLDHLSPRDMEKDLDYALHQHTAARESEEAAEGMAAFAEKRKPNWQQ